MLCNDSHNISPRKKRNVATKTSFAISVESLAIRQDHIIKEPLRKGYIEGLDKQQPWDKEVT